MNKAELIAAVAASAKVSQKEAATVIAAVMDELKDALKKGDKVNHRKFGNGMVISVSPSGGDHLVEILFDNVGTKNLMASIAKLKKL